MMDVFIALILFLIFLYAIILLGYYKSLQSINPKSVQHEEKNLFISIVVIARNEEDNLPGLFLSFSELNYSKNNYEIILADDDSSDQTIILMNRFKEQSNVQVKIIRLNHSENRTNHKKFAIERCVEIAAGDLIALTDADCRVSKNWLFEINHTFSDNSIKFAAGPVQLQTEENRKLFNWFEAFEWCVLQTITYASITKQKQVLCNAANMVFSKQAFIEVNGYSGNKASSGDDVFLMFKIKQMYGRESIRWIHQKSTVITTSIKHFKSFIFQRIRWASKSKYYRDFDVVYLGSILFLTNLCMALLPVISAFYPILVNLFILVFFIKFLVDSLLVYKGSKVLNIPLKYSFLLVFEIVYPFYFLMIAIMSLFVKPVWKGRIINR